MVEVKRLSMAVKEEKWLATAHQLGDLVAVDPRMVIAVSVVLVLVDTPVVPALTATVTLVAVVDPIIMDQTNRMRQEHAKAMDWSRSQPV